MTTSLPRVLHVITGLDTGGAERSLFNLLQSRLRDRFDNQVVSLSGPGHYGPLLHDLGISVHALGMREGTGAVGALLRLRTLVREIAPAIVQGWMYHGNLAASAAAWGRSPKPAVSWNIRQSLDVIGLEKRGTRWTINALKPLSGAPRAIIYNSYRACGQHEAHGYSGARSIVIPNGFDTQKWRPDAARRVEWRKKLGLTADEVALGYVGRFHPMKDIPTFLDACDRSLSSSPNLRVVMIGEGLDENNRAIVNAIAPEKRARFRLLGRRPDVETILPAFDLFCLASSRNEGFPNVLGEAMASGLPSVATDVGDSARLMNGLGRVVPPGDAAQMAEAIGEIAGMDLARRSEMGKAARDRIVATYGLDATVEAYGGLYDSMLKRDD
ncbi:glycosyltransferase [Sphingopyxis sp. MC1]|uniref:glycosyltransferase n=1 Tax=Sphingopyxis sp. MC1 TaxID=1174684 RepID=UPI0002D1AAE8|nr:glycosyltransferase [Sphingopyxis sp. MC1]ENY81455.1 group 1 glycosyl transferase [Sphingopyxis sp. MC1]